MGKDLERLRAVISQTIGQFEEKQMGVKPKEVKVIIDSDLIIIHLKEMLSPAEKHLALSEKGQSILQHFNNMLFEDAQPLIEDLVVETMGKDMVDVQTAISPLTGSIVAVFSLDNRREV